MMWRSAVWYWGQGEVFFGEHPDMQRGVEAQCPARERSLRAMGALRGDRVGVLEDNGVHAVDAYVGMAVGGYIRVLLGARNSRW